MFRFKPQYVLYKSIIDIGSYPKVDRGGKSAKIFIFFLLLFCRLHAVQLSVCGIFQNEAEFLDEWIYFHELQGIRHFYLYNNLSTDHYEEVLKKHKNVTLIEWNIESNNISEWNAIQLAAFNHCLATYGDRSDWIAFIDTDEFLFCPDGKKVSLFLQDYSSYGGVAVNWVMFGTTIPNIPEHYTMIELLTKRAPLDCSSHQVIKSIVNTSRNPSYNYDPHLPQSSGTIVNSDFNPVYNPISNTLCIDKIRIHHYWTRTEEFMLNNKIPRQAKWGNPNVEAILSGNQAISQEYDKTILQFVPRLLRKMGFAPSRNERQNQVF